MEWADFIEAGQSSLPTVGAAGRGAKGLPLLKSFDSELQ